MYEVFIRYPQIELLQLFQGDEVFITFYIAYGPLTLLIIRNIFLRKEGKFRKSKVLET